jgi:signal transduction histidine kinase
MPDRPAVRRRLRQGREPVRRRVDPVLARAVGRLPVSVRTKLLVAFAVIAVLLVAVAGIGLGVLGRSNARVESLGTLQLRAATYQTLQTQARQLRQLLGLRVAEDPNVNTYLGRAPGDAPSGANWVLVDQAIAAALTQLLPATNGARFGFVPPPQDQALLARARADDRRLSRALQQVTDVDRANASSTAARPMLIEAIDAVNDLGAITDSLASTTRAQTDALIAQNASAYWASRNLFFGAGAVSLALALLLGLVLSWSVVGPIRRTEARLAEIAAGDFSRHLEVANRDELGALAANLNRMSDELSRLYGELETANRHKSEFLANMSHELRTPLNAVIGFSELLLLEHYGRLNEHQAEFARDIGDAGRHLLALINDILDLSKVEAGKMELQLSSVSLRETLETGVKMHAERATRAGIELGLTVEPDDIVLTADERKLRQIVFNLLSNAVKFAPPGGRVEIMARATPGSVEVVVSDNGCGVAPEDLELIFDEFRQGAGRRPDGTGLGLPLSRRFVELHGGRLWVESEMGSGATFRFTLPAETEA